jgi:hypothetical protein
MTRQLISLFLTFAAANVAFADDNRRESEAFFENKVRPILVKRCFDCHSNTKQKGGLRVDHIGYLKSGGDTGPALIPGKPEESPFIEAIHYADEDFQMPPKNNGGKIPDSEIKILEDWVRMGAPWPENADSKIVVTEGGFTEEQRNYWFFKPVADVTPPVVDSKWVRNDIDRFIAAKHAETKLTPAAEADRHELVRRVYYDLHGLPPTREEIEDFVNDTDPQAYEKLIDTLLASPRYGERWGQHWLDLVRYAESDGYNADGYRPSVWPYRDYVIKSLNEDKPYDQFVREQLAGDEIDPDNPDVLIATCFLRNPVYEWNQRDVRGQWDIILTDMTDTTGELFLGLSMGCAHCHNHKFDPILQKDYYRLRAFLAPVHWRDDLKLATPQEQKAFDEQQAKWEAATAEIRGKMDALIGTTVQGKVDTALGRFTEDLQTMVRKPAQERDSLETQLAGLCERQMTHERDVFDPMKSLKKDEEKAEYQALQEELKKFDSLKPEPLLDAFVATDTGKDAPKVSIKTRKGEQEVNPGFLSILEPEEPEIKPIGNSTGRRTVLANWITRPDNQLSTRVIVNRIWQYHFGQGIVKTASDFGKLGESPSHPELLDFLAKKFVTNGWHMKPLHREIMLSATYRQSARVEPGELISKVDPTNRYLWRFPPRRLDAEQIRDALLAVSGELDPTPGGPGEAAEGLRRSIYTIKKRNKPNELLSALDMPAGFASTAERQSTTTPTQALLLINGDWLLSRASSLSQRVGHLNDAWLAVLGRLPTDRELDVATSFLETRVGKAAAPAEGGSPAAATKDADSRFKENSERERIIVRGTEKEGDVFTVEAIVTLDSIDANASVRTIASRWTGGKDSIESFGWRLGLTGEKSAYKPRNVVVQLVGEDENANIGYEVVASNIHIELGRRYHIAARVSCADHRITFTVQDLDTAGSTAQSAVVPHTISAHLGDGASSLVIGGLNGRSVSHQWDGQIEALRVSSGLLDDKSISPDFKNWSGSLVSWQATVPGGLQFSSVGPGSVESSDPYRQAMNDLCQVLLNTNEFFYLH